MKYPSVTRQLEPPTLEQFRSFVKKIISVPKAKIDQRETEYQNQRRAKKRKHLSRS